MRTALRAGLAGALAVTMVSATMIDDAEARSRRVIGGVAAGLVIGSALAAGAVYARPRYYAAPTYYYAAPGCTEFKRRAQYNDDIGRYDRARHWWDRYAACKDGH